MRRLLLFMATGLVALSLLLADCQPAAADTATAPLPDLVVTGVTFSPASPKQGDGLSAQVTVKNQGAGQAVFRNGQSVVESKSPFFAVASTNVDFVIAPGASKTFQLIELMKPNNPPAAGNHNVQFTVDPGGAVAESNENNNTASFPLTVAAGVAKPVIDLAVESFRVDPPNGTTSTKFTFTLVIKNLGNVPATLYDFSVTGGVRSGNNTVIAPGATYKYVSDWFQLQAGLRTITTTVNVSKLSEDANPANNSRAVQVEVVDPAIGNVGHPDLKLEIVTKQYDVMLGDPLKIRCVLYNSGSADALLPIGAAVVQAKEGGKILGSYDSPKDWILWPGTYPNVIDLIIPTEQLTGGQHTIVVTADPKNVTGDQNASNNQVTVQVNVKGPDLAVTAVKVTPEKPKSNSTLTLDVTLKNLGQTKAVFPSGAVLFSYRAQGFNNHTLVLNKQVELAPGQELTTTAQLQPFTQTVGTYNILVNLDPANIIGDPSRSNNEFTVPVTLVRPSLQELTQQKPADKQDDKPIIHTPAPGGPGPNTPGPNPGTNTPGPNAPGPNTQH